MLRGSRQVGVITYEHRDVHVPELIPDELPHRDIPPPQSRGIVEVSILGPNETWNRDPDGNDPGPVPQAGQQRPDKATEILHDPLRVRPAEGSVATRRGDDLASEADYGRPHPVRCQVDGKCARTVLAQLHNRRRAAGRPRDQL